MVKENIRYILGAGMIVLLEKIRPLAEVKILYGIEAGNNGAGLIVYGRWILLFVPIFLENVLRFERQIAGKELTMHRIGCRWKWIGRFFCKAGFSCLTYTVILYCLFGFVEKEGEKLVLAAILFFLHCLLLVGMYVVFRISGRESIISLNVILLFEGGDAIFSKVFYEMPLCCPWRWGMLNYFERYEEMRRLIFGVGLVEVSIFF